MVRSFKRVRRPGRICVYCGQPAELYDHIIPLALGGADSGENKV